MTRYSPQQGAFFAHRITLEGLGEDTLAQSLSTARVDMNPHQIDAALFALSIGRCVIRSSAVGSVKHGALSKSHVYQLLRSNDARVRRAAFHPPGKEDRCRKATT
jgi:hypothetical protein